MRLRGLLQRSTLTGAWQAIIPNKTFVAATGWPQGSSPFTDTVERLAADPTWMVHRWSTRHNILHDGPQRLLELLLAI